MLPVLLSMSPLRALLTVYFLGLAVAVSSSGRRLLVAVEEQTEKAKYSTFWGDLEARGYHITFESPKSDAISLFQHGERMFDHLLLLPPKSKGLGPAFTPKKLLQFISEEGNILLVLSGLVPVPPALSSLLLELEIQLPQDRTSTVVDHFNYDTSSAADQHDVLLLPSRQSSRRGVRTLFNHEGVLAFPRAVGQELGANGPLLSSVLRAESTAYISSASDESDHAEDPFAVGTQISLVSTFQARNSARFTVFGSAEALETRWFDAKVKAPSGSSSVTANRPFANEITSWTFQEIGVLKVDHVEHRLLHDSNGNASNQDLADLASRNPAMYRIKNDVIFQVGISEYRTDRWTPFQTEPGDFLQLEFTMLSPFHRLNLIPTGRSENSTVFGTNFRLPDQHGIFRFEVNYKRPFLTNVNVKREVTVRHFAHDEWPRSWQISGGWVWIAGIWTTIVAWIAFVCIWLWSASPSHSEQAKKRQ